MRARKSITNLFQLLVLYMNMLTGQYHYTGGGQDLETETPATLYQPVQEKREMEAHHLLCSITLYSYHWYMYCTCVWCVCLFLEVCFQICLPSLIIQ